MYRTILFWFVLVFAIPSQGQILVIKDKVTRLPLELVNVYSLNPHVADVTDSQGRADLKGFEGADSIIVEIIGYKPLVLSYRQLKAKQFQLFLEEVPILMNQVFVSATRWQQMKKDVPNKIIAIRPLEIQMQNPQTAADLLGTSGEIFIQKSQLGGGSPMIRGFSANRILIAVDGVRMNTAIFRSGNLQNVISLDPFATENTEIIFGPGSVIYGSDAIGGVMSFYTLEPKISSGDKPFIKGSGIARSSSAAFEKTGHINLNIGLKKWAFVTSASFTDFDDLKMGDFGPKDYLRPHYIERINERDSVVINSDPNEQIFTGYSQLNLMQKIRFKPNENWDLNYGFHYSRSSNVPRYDRLIQYKNGQLQNANWFYGPQKWMMNSLNIHNKKLTQLYNNARLTLAYQKFEESRHDRNFGKNGFRHRTETVDVFSANLDFEKSFQQKHRLFYGVEIVLNKVGSVANEENVITGNSIPTSTRYPDGSTWNSYALYLNSRYNVNNQITLQTGLRYNRIALDSKFDTTLFPFPFTSAKINTGSLTGSLGLVYRPEKTWEINLNFSSGFRAPNVDDMGKVFDSEPGSVIVPNPNLKPEYAYNSEIGISKTFNEMVKLDVVGYYTWLRDALVRREFILNGQDSVFYDGTLSQVLAIQNAAEAYVWGFQTGVEIILPKGFGLLSRFNFQKGEEELENGSSAPLRHAGPWFGVTHVIYKRERFKADFYGIYNGEITFKNLAPEEQNKPHLYAVDKSGNPYSLSWYTLNIKFIYQFSDFFMLSAGIENITNQRYRPYSSGIAAPGRNFIIALNITF